MDQPTAVDLQQTLAWLHQKIAFERRPLGEVADEFNRYGPIPIEIDDAAFLQTLDGVRVERTNARLRFSSVKLQKD